MDRLTFSSLEVKSPGQIRRELRNLEIRNREIEITASRVTTRERGIIPGCRKAGPDSHMAVDKQGRPYVEVAKLPSTIDAWLAAGWANVLASRKSRPGACWNCGEQPKPKHPQGKRYCQCAGGHFRPVEPVAEAA